MNYSDLQGKISSSCDFYSDYQLSEAIKRIILLTEYSYNELIELNFSRFKKYMNHYNNYCYKLIWNKRNKQYGAGVDSINIKVAEEKIGIESITNEEGPHYPYI